MSATSDSCRPTALARFLRLVGQMARLLALCCARREGRRGLFLFGLVLGLNLIGIPITVRLISWSADFYNALQKADAAAAVEQIGVFAGLTVLSATTFLIASYLRKRLVMLWRRELTSALLDRWLAAQVFWQAGKDGEAAAIENPDQRVGEDAALFLERVLGEEGGRGNVLSLITSVVALVSYVTVLWNLSTFALPLSFLGLSIEIPRYMVWAAPIYVAVSSAITHWLGAPLKNLMFEQQRREGDFRFALARLRENAEPVALAGGQAVEREILGQRFEAIASNWYALIRRELIQGTFTRPYFQTVLRIPMFLALPAFLAGRVTLGGLMQIASAFQNVVTTLSWFIFAYHDLAELAAATSRLDGFLCATERPLEAYKNRTANTTPTSPDGLGWSDLRLLTPTGTGLLALPDAWFEPGAPI
jgi:putative ATP-binding cassette transporter